jgi:signal transduction histidine kinase
MNLTKNTTPPAARRPWRLRTRLALALLAVFIPISVVIIASHLENLNDRRDSRIESLETISETVAAVMNGFAGDLETYSLSTSRTLAQLPSSSLYNNPGMDPYLQDLADSYGNLRTIFLTDANGIVVASSLSQGAGSDVSSRPYIVALRSGQETVWTGSFAGLQGTNQLLAFGRTITTIDGQVFYMIIAFEPSLLVRRLPPNLPAEARISLIDDRGKLIYVSEDPGHPLDEANFAGWQPFQTARQGQTAVIKSQPLPLTEEERHGALAPIERTDWVVGMTVPTSIIDGPADARFRRDLLIIGALLFGGLAAIIVIASRLSSPLANLAVAAGAIARGERPQIPLGTAPDADVRRLEEAMNTMSQAVLDREERLQAQARVLQTLEWVGESLATELNFEKAVASITDAAVNVTGADLGVLYHRKSQDADFELLNLSGEYDSFPFDRDDPVLQSTFAGETVAITDLATLAGASPVRRFEENGHASVRSLLGIPVISRSGDIQGALILLHRNPAAFNDYQQGLAIGLARRASIVLENARLFSEAHEVQDQLRKANAAKDEFLALISHELRTPITTIFGGARLLHSRRRALPEESTDEMIASIEDEAERLYRLVEDLLAIARADLATEVKREELPLAASVEQVVKQFSARHPARPIDVQTAADPPVVLAEATYVQQVLNNFISNADKYAEPGLPIDIQIEAEGGEGIVRVLDRGPGVPEDEMDRIFDSFYRSQRTSRQASGKGLGLTVCKRLVEAMSGRIWARPREGGGLEVGFALPLADERPAVEEVGAGQAEV